MHSAGIAGGHVSVSVVRPYREAGQRAGLNGGGAGNDQIAGWPWRRGDVDAKVVNPLKGALGGTTDGRADYRLVGAGAKTSAVNDKVAPDEVLETYWHTLVQAIGDGMPVEAGVDGRAGGQREGVRAAERRGSESRRTSVSNRVANRDGRVIATAAAQHDRRDAT